MGTYLRLLVFRDHPIAALAVICLSVFVISVDATIVNVALPTLSRELDADTTQLQWIVDAYTLVMSGLLLSVGSLSDRYGRRGWLSAGLAVVAITSAVAAQVNSADALIAARAAMGVGAAVIFPTTLGLITNIFTDPAPRGRAIGLWAAMVGVGVAVGPITGGWLLEHFSWGSIFLVNVPVAVVAIVGGSLDVPTSRDPAAPRVDVGGLILSSIGVTALVYTVIEAPNWGWSSTRTTAGFGLAIVVLTGFALWERRSSHPMLDVSVFTNRRFSGGSLAVTAGFLTLFGFIFVITQYFQFIKSYSAFETGVRLLPVAASIAAASILGPRMVERFGTTVVVVAGLAVFAAGLGWASTVDGSTPYTMIATQMVLLGAGLGLTTAPSTEAIMGSLRPDKAGVGSAINDTTRELGGTLGVAIVGSVFASVYSGRLAAESALTTLPGDVRATMGRSMAAAYQVIAQLPAGRVGGVRDAVNDAFLNGLQVGSLVCAGIALGAAVVVAWLLPARAQQAVPSITEQPALASRVRLKGKDMQRNEIAEQSYTAMWSNGRGEVKYFTRSDRSRLRYFTAGTGPALVLLHTVRTQLDYFQRVIPQLWDSFTVYAVDLPGHGMVGHRARCWLRRAGSACRGRRVCHRAGSARRHARRRIARRRARVVRVDRPQGQSSPGRRVQQLRLPQRTRTGQLVSPVHRHSGTPAGNRTYLRPDGEQTDPDGCDARRVRRPSQAVEGLPRGASKKRQPQGIPEGRPSDLPQPQRIHRRAPSLSGC